jgi:hypothetical protein
VIAGVRGSRVGLYHFDVEPDATSAPAKGIRVGEIVGRNVGVGGHSSEVVADLVEFGSLDLSPAHSSGSSPDYFNSLSFRPHGLTIKDAISVKVGTFKARGFERQAIRYLEGSSSGMRLDITDCDVSECCRNDPVYNAYVIGRPDEAQISIQNLIIRLDRPDSRGLFFCNNANIGAVRGSLADKTIFLWDSAGATIGTLALDAPGSLLVFNTQGAQFNGGQVSVDGIGHYCDKLTFRDMVLTGQFRGGSLVQEHYLERTTLNGIYYQSAVYRPFAT